MNRPEGEIHVRSAWLDALEPRLPELWLTLCATERQRAERFVFERDRKRFVLGRGLLREILASYAGIRPEVLVFECGDRGKPFLREPADLFFNISHSDAAFVAAVGSCELGIDVERVRPVSDAAQLAERFFTAAEAEFLKGLTGDRQQAAFFRIWTQKEAFLKATGEGITGLQRVEVALPEDEGLSKIDGCSAIASQWLVRRFVPFPGFAAALAVAGTDWRVCFLEEEF